MDTHSSQSSFLSEDHGLGSSSPGGDHSPTAATILRTGHLPSPQLGNIQDIDGAIKTLARTQAIREKICERIQNEVCRDPNPPAAGIAEPAI